MVSEVEIIPPDRYEPQARVDVASGPGANPIWRFLDRQKSKSIDERRKVVRALAALIDDTKGLNQSYEDYKVSLVSLSNLDKTLESERVKFLKSLEVDEWKFLKQIQIDQLKLVTEHLELEIKRDELLDRKKIDLTRERDELHLSNEILDVQHRRDQLLRRSDQFYNPAEKKTPPDPTDDAIKAAFAGGGRYTQQVNEHREQLIKERGGVENLTEDDQERIRNAYAAAAKGDYSKGR